MTSLQWSLAILAIALIAIVLIYNAIQRRKLTKRLTQSRADLMQQTTADSASNGRPRAPAQDYAATNPEPTRATDSKAKSTGVPIESPSPDFQSNEFASPVGLKAMDDLDGPMSLRAEPRLGDGFGEPVLQRFEIDGPKVSASELAHDDLTQDPKAQQEQAKGLSFAGLVKAKPAPAGAQSPSNGATSVAADPNAQVPTDSPPKTDAWMLRSYGLNKMADCIVTLGLREPVSGERLHHLTGGLRRVGGKPVICEAQDHLGEWQPIVAGERYEGLRLGVLMANRHGPLNAMEFSDFAAAAQKIADHFEVHIDIPDMQQTLQRARALDVKCASLDAQIGLNVRTEDNLSTEQLAAVAQEFAPLFGLVERGNNRYCALGQHGEVLFSMALGDRPQLLTLLLDVPRAPSAAQPWAKMVDCANRCSARFGGVLVDDADRPLNQDALDRIGGQLGQRYQSLIEEDMTAGSPVALRLFN
jgi:FtsZ-interacting cell division protein ZipA